MVCLFFTSTMKTIICIDLNNEVNFIIVQSNDGSLSVTSPDAEIYWDLENLQAQHCHIYIANVKDQIMKTIIALSKDTMWRY